MAWETTVSEGILGGVRETASFSRKAIDAPIVASLPHMTQQILNFCRRERILRYLTLAIGLVEEYFPSVRGLTFEVVQDPETDEEWLALGVSVAGDTGELLDRYERCTQQWVTRIPWPETNKICLCFDVE